MTASTARWIAARSPGGATNFGITIADYRRHVKPNATAADVRAMPVDEAKAIYHARYWMALRCDEFPPGLDYALFDYGVNSGTSRAAKVLQRILGLPVDGRVTEKRDCGGAPPLYRRFDQPHLRRAARFSSIAQDVAGLRQGLAKACRRGEGGCAGDGW